MTTFCRITTSLLCLFGVACTSSPVRTNFGAVDRFVASVEYVGSGNAQISQEYYSKDLVLAFPLVVGEIFGKPVPEVIFTKKIDDTMTFSLEPVQKIDKVANMARVMKSEWISRGLRIKPDNTKIARLATFPYDRRTRKQVGGGGFIDAVTRDSLILIYVHQASTIRGSLELEGSRYVHRLDFPAQGFYWIKALRTSSHEYLITGHNSDQISFSIQVEVNRADLH